MTAILAFKFAVIFAMLTMSVIGLFNLSEKDGANLSVKVSYYVVMAIIILAILL